MNSVVHDKSGEECISELVRAERDVQSLKTLGHRICYTLQFPKRYQAHVSKGNGAKDMDERNEDEINIYIVLHVVFIPTFCICSD